MSVTEVNFDSLIGPTHHYGGLAEGNVASRTHARQISHPRQAALQGLQKMLLLQQRGILQAVLPPHFRPHLRFLRTQGFRGDDRSVLAAVANSRPDLLSITYSASSMWTANAATVSPSADTLDGRVHLTPANLLTHPHRALEADWTTALLRQIFHDPRLFAIHDPLPSDPELADEGAANQMRLAIDRSSPGVEVFVYGRQTTNSETRYPARQTLAASQQIARQHQLPAERTLFLQQHPQAIDAGVFHNDVIAVANETLLLCHERAFVDQPQQLTRLNELLNGQLQLFQVTAAELSLEEAVRTYLFNSQLVTLPTGGMLLLCPCECAESPAVETVLQRLQTEQSQVVEVVFVDVRQSMKNGGGPACLRLRVPLTEAEWLALPPGIKFSPQLHDQLTTWVNTHYRETLTLDDLRDPAFADEVRHAFQELASIFEIGPLIPELSE